MKIPIPKLKAMMRFFGTYTDERLLGKTKLMKLFYFVDFEHTRKFGSPITYDDYYHLDHGPIPSVIKNLVDEVDDDFDNATLSDTISIEQRDGSALKRISSARKFSEKDLKYFSDTEMQTMKAISKRFETATAKEIEKASHEEAPWQETRFGEKISYLLALKGAESNVKEEEVSLFLNIVNS